MSGSQWAIYGERTLPNGGLVFQVIGHATTILSGGVEFVMPDASGASPGYVNYLEDNFNTNLAETNTVTVTFNVVTSGTSTAFLGNPDGGNSAISFVRIFLQSNLATGNDNAPCIGPGYNEYNYWWSNPLSYHFAAGGTSTSVTLTTALSPGAWSDMCGAFGSSAVTNFDAALAKVTIVGLSFGSGSFFANGLGVDGTTGNATFQLIDFVIA